MVLRYMSGSKNKCLCLGQGNASIIGYINSHYVGCSDNRKPTLGYIFQSMEEAQSWRSCIKECTTLFITEAKYVATSEACKEYTMQRTSTSECDTISSENALLLAASDLRRLALEKMSHMH